MKKIKYLLPFICIFFLLSSCITFDRTYSTADEGYTEGSTDIGPILTFIRFFFDNKFVFPFSFLQFILPLPYEKYVIQFNVSNINDKITETDDDIMRFMYFDEFRILFPSGKVIDLLDSKIDIMYSHSGSEYYSEEQNVKPQYMDGMKILYIDGLKDGDRIRIRFFTKIPAYFVNNVRIEYKLTVEWKNKGTVKKRYVSIFNKKLHSWLFPTA